MSSVSVVQLLTSFKSAIRVRNVIDKPIIDNKIFRLHYRTTTVILFVCCAFVSAYTLFGDPIQCVGDIKVEEKRKVANTFCYLGYMYTIPKNQNSDEKLAGIGQGDEKKYFSYYRWVPLMLFLQGVLFYLPHWIWKNWEDKKLDHLTREIRGPIAEVTKEHRSKLKNLAKYAADSFHTHNLFASVYYFCEILNFINVIINIYLINTFLDGAFLGYGFDVLNYTDMPQENRTDPMIKIFPRVTKCDFHKVGPSGSIQTYDFMCILALNNVNEKIYIFLWFWLLFLGCVSIIPIVYNVTAFFSPALRKRELEKHYILGEKFRVVELARRTEIGDFFLWNLMGVNMSSKCYREFIDELYECFIE